LADAFEQNDFLFLLEEAYTQEAGEPQIALSFDYGFDGEDWALAGEFEYGLTKSLQVFVEVPFQNSPQTDFDIDNVEFGVDYAFLKDRGPGSTPEATVGVAVIAPVGESETENWRLEPSLRLSKNILEPIYLHAGAAAELNIEDEDAMMLAEWTVGGGVGWRPRELLTFTAEYLRETEREEEFGVVRREVEHIVAGSVSYEIDDDVLIGAGASQAVSGSGETRLIIQAQVEW
jgi:hypothetical protein